MSSYYERYLQGEHTAVWDELTQLGEAVFTEPLHADALAVAREAMRRVQEAIILLQHRLLALDYRFGVTHFEPETCFWMEDEVRPPPPYAPARADAQEKLATLEATHGRLALSFRAWHEHIDSVNFVGTFIGAEADQAAEAMTEALTETVRVDGSLTDTDEAQTRLPRHAEKPTSRRFLSPAVLHFMRAHPERADPFWYWPSLPTWHEILTHSTTSAAYDVLFCPDVFVKGGKPGGIAYSIAAQGSAADVWVESERWRMRFVPYLRHCLLEWGGFPGLGELDGLPSSVMAPLTSGLTPF